MGEETLQRLVGLAREKLKLPGLVMEGFGITTLWAWVKLKHKLDLGRIDRYYVSEEGAHVKRSVEGEEDEVVDHEELNKPMQIAYNPELFKGRLRADHFLGRKGLTVTAYSSGIVRFFAPSLTSLVAAVDEVASEWLHFESVDM